MKRKKISLRILFISIAVLCITAAILLFINAYNCHIAEMQAQIEQFGFYKSDITLLIDNHYHCSWSLIGGGTLTVSGCVSIFLLFLFTTNAF